MPAIKDILKHVSVETARRKRKCHRGKNKTISAGDKCLVVQTGMANEKHNYSQSVAKEILDKAWQKLAYMYGELDLAIPEKKDGAQSP